jgi:hypothetical protein
VKRYSSRAAKRTAKVEEVMLASLKEARRACCGETWADSRDGFMGGIFKGHNFDVSSALIFFPATIITSIIDFKREKKSVYP